MQQTIATQRISPLCTQPVSGKTGETVTMLFVSNRPALSTMERFADGDMHAGNRINHSKVSQTTISLNDLLARYDAPKQIDFISIDTEGSELEILGGFDFGRHDVRLFAIEHNHTPAEKEIDLLMRRHGYERVHRFWSRWDAWYRKII
jgi:hypothetical protein